MHLTKLQQDALMEFDSRSWAVPWKPKTMQSLMRMGLTREVRSWTDKRPYYALTDEGKKVLEEVLNYERYST